MKKLVLFICIFIAFQLSCNAMTTDCSVSSAKVFSKDNVLFGLQTENGQKITDAEFNKLVRLGDNSWIVQRKTKYGIIDNNGNFLVKPRYRHAERYMGKYAKLGNSNDFGVYDEYGNIIVQPKYQKIDILFGRMFLTYKNFKYGVVNVKGQTVLANEFDDIYMSSNKTLKVKFNGEWFEIEQSKTADASKLSENSAKISINDEEFIITRIITNTGIVTGYSALTATDYIIKIFSSLSPAYEDTIDELMLSHGTDTVTIFMKLSWLPKFPATYAQKYYRNFANPNNGLLSDVRENVIKQYK